MIISASRRTDIPAFYGQWLVQRLREGYVMVQNPRNPDRYSHVVLNSQTVDAIVFWSKNPAPLLPRLKEIDAMGYLYYFQFTLTPYDRDVETKLPPKRVLLDTFLRLSQMIGADRVVWRYDPVLLSAQHDLDYHIRSFDAMAKALHGATKRCFISFLDSYAHIRRQMQSMGVIEITNEDMLYLAKHFAASAARYGMALYTCCEPVDLSPMGVEQGACIDAEMLRQLLGTNIVTARDPNQRPHCGCMESVEIGAYDGCPHGCRYCYATTSAQAVQGRFSQHDPMSPILFGQVPHGAVITERKMESVKEYQLRFC